MKAGEISSSFPTEAIIKNPFSQLIGIFTRPSVVFKSLRIAPNWIWALTLSFITSITTAKLYLTKQTLASTEKLIKTVNITGTTNLPDPQKTAQLIQSTFNLFTLALLGVFTLAMTLYIFWRLAGEDDQIGFRQAWAVAIVHSLALLPATLLQGIFCIIRPAGSLAGYSSITPTSLLFWIPIENSIARGLIYIMDPFYIFSIFALALGCHYTLQLKAWALRTCLLIIGLLSLYFRFKTGMI